MMIDFKNILPIAVIGFEIIMIGLYGVFVDYSKENTTSDVSATVNQYYPLYQDVHVMILVGFGFLMTFLKKYAYSALGYTMLITAITIQASILINGFFHNLFNNSWHYLDLDIKSLITGDFASGAVLISFGALLGKINPLQLFIMALFEMIFYAVNESIGVIVFKAIDMGGSMFVHTFGAYFGLSVAWILSRNNIVVREHRDESSSKQSNTNAMVGTLFLWMFWPSFNGALAVGNAQHRVILNTVFALCSSCLGAFCVSQLYKGKFSMEHVQNATLAGGVAVGSSSDLVIAPYGALITGLIAGTISVVGYETIGPWLEKKIGLHDTCGVHNLHGIPGIMGGLGGFISSCMASNTLYGSSIAEIFPARGEGRTAIEQGGFQLATLFTTLGIAIGGGLLTGLVLKQNIFAMDNRDLYRDDGYWEVEQSDDEQIDIEAETQTNNVESNEIELIIQHDEKNV